MALNANTVTVTIPSQVYQDLQILAAEERLDVGEVLRQLVAQARRRQSTPSSALTRILERATDLGVEDLAEQHDHYLYGVEKQ